MAFIVTRKAKGYDVEMMFNIIARFVMVALSGLAAIGAFLRSNWSQPTGAHGTLYRLACLDFQEMLLAVLFAVSLTCLRVLAPRGLFFALLLPFSALLVLLFSYPMAWFTGRLKTIGAIVRVPKTGNWKRLLAFATAFCLNGLRHDFFPIRKSCLESIAGTYLLSTRSILGTPIVLSTLIYSKKRTL